RTFVYLMWIFVMGFAISLTHQLSSRLFGGLIIIGGIFYLRATMDWEEKRIKEMVKRKQL
ncbi:MAG: hypothetical protein Q8898_09750, partial [Bacillota bacterium]|nr:hypothetical protein [Bacillota bacterium]